LSTRSRLAPFAKPAALFTAALTALVVLFRFPPDRYDFYPRCPIYTYLHLQCPGCGTTRALSALLHGHLREALHQNPLTTILLPIILLYLAYSYSQRSSRPDRLLTLPIPILYSLFAVAAIFTVTRNLPWL
jgi:hypothetical protein